MEISNKSITRYLSSAKICVTKALLLIKENDELSAQTYIRKAIHMLRIADTLIIRKHMTVCIKDMIHTNPSNIVVEEIMKTYKYVSS